MRSGPHQPILASDVHSSEARTSSSLRRGSRSHGTLCAVRARIAPSWLHPGRTGACEVASEAVVSLLISEGKREFRFGGERGDRGEGGIRKILCSASACLHGSYEQNGLASKKFWKGLLTEAECLVESKTRVLGTGSPGTAREKRFFDNLVVMTSKV